MSLPYRSFDRNLKHAMIDRIKEQEQIAPPIEIRNAVPDLPHSQPSLRNAERKTQNAGCGEQEEEH